MKISSKTEYALLALIDMARHMDDGYIKISGICERNSIPKKFLEQILINLKGAGIVRSRRGQAGGYSLARDPSEIFLAEVIRLLDGPLASVGSASRYFYSESPIEQNEKLLSVFREVRDYISERMETTSIAQLV